MNKSVKYRLFKEKIIVAWYEIVILYVSALIVGASVTYGILDTNGELDKKNNEEINCEVITIVENAKMSDFERDCKEIKSAEYSYELTEKWVSCGSYEIDAITREKITSLCQKYGLSLKLSGISSDCFGFLNKDNYSVGMY